MSERANALADRLELGARRLAAFANVLNEAQWQARVPDDGRRISVIVHHVASMYPLQIQLAQTLARRKPITGVTADVVSRIKADHARQHDAVTKAEALDLLGRNSVAAGDAIRALSDDDLDGAASVSLYGGASLTCQFMLEDHAVRHSYHHLAVIRAAVNAQLSAA